MRRAGTLAAAALVMALQGAAGYAAGAAAPGTASAAAAAVPATTPAAAARPAGASPAVPANLKPRRNGEESVFDDERGYSIYTSDEDSLPGESKCLGECATIWPPFPAAADATPIGSFTILERTDGIRQWVYRGKPLYTYSRDEYPGGAFGDGVANRWRRAFGVLRMPPGFDVFKTPIGRILVDEKSLTLYAPKPGSAALKSGCDSACLRDWAPAVAPALARDSGDWTLLTRADGTQQWAFKGQPLYAARADRRAGDLRGQDVGGADWGPIVIRPESPSPEWTTLVRTDIGQLFADASGMTVYAFNGRLEVIKRNICDDACLKQTWTPVAAAAEVAPVGDWSVKKDADGALYWAYRGAPLYTFNRDKVPGEVLGRQFAAGAGIFGSWFPIVRIPY